MRKSNFLLIIFFCGFTLNVFAQAKPCDENTDTKTSCYEYKNDIFDNYQAMFKDGETYFTLFTGKKMKKISLSEQNSLEDLLLIAQNKKLKISATDMLFIYEAVKVWNIEKRKLGFEYTDSQLGIKIIKEGDGVLPTKGQNVTVHYSGYLENGKKFDSSVDRDEPFSFQLGMGRVIKGWDEGISRLPIGCKAVLEIPSDLAYGSRGAGATIPPNATLYFEIEVLSVE